MDKTEEAIRRYAGTARPQSRPEIEWRAGELDLAVDAAERVLIASGERIYQRGDMLVRVVRRPAISARNFGRTAGTIGLIPLEMPYLCDVLTRLIDWRKPHVSAKELRPINCPDRVAITFLARVGRWKVPHLGAVIDAPTMRRDGTVLQTPGYDEDTAILYDPGGIEYPEIPDHPTRAQAEDALEVLDDAIKDFPWVGPVDRSVALATILSALVRRSLPAAPLTGITAPVMASGKTLLADVVSLIASGVSAAAMVQPHDEEEASKLLLSILLEGKAVVLIDNVERPLEGASLCTALTGEVFSARLLGRNATVQVPTRCSWIATGNALVLVGDLRTRALLCRLDPRCERPEERAFDGDLREQIAARRPELVAAGLTIVRAFITSGVSASALVRPWGRFEAWSDRVRAPLVWLGLTDPYTSLALLDQEDPERVRLAAMLHLWYDLYGGNSATARDLIERTRIDDSKCDVIAAVARDRSGKPDALRLGHWLQRVEGRIVDGMQFRRDGKIQGVVRWCVVIQPRNEGRS